MLKTAICIKMDLVLNNPQWLICHKTKPNKRSVAVVSTELNGFNHGDVTLRFFI